MSALKYWLWLTELPGLTNQTRLALLRHFPTPEDVYYADPEEVLLTEGITREQAANRAFLRDLMLRHGFVDYENEWWHYSLAQEPYPETYFDFLPG